MSKHLMQPRRLRTSNLVSSAALLPATILFLGIYVVCTAWSIYISTTASRLLPSSNFVGLRQYAALFADERWHEASRNILIYGALTISACLILGTLMAIVIDQKLRAEDLFRSIFLFPYSMSFIVTGLIWRWLLEPTLGVQSLLDGVGLGWVKADWIVDESTVIYALVVAGVWHGAGLVMTLVLASLRGIDDDIWKAIRVDGIPKWRAYISVILPMLGGAFATATLLLAISVVKIYDLVVAMTNGGPGFASDMPAKVVMDALFERQNAGLATAGATTMLLTVAAILVPWFYWRGRGRRGASS